MLKDKLKTSNKNHWKMNVLYLLLIISNIVLFIGLFGYYSKIGFDISFKNFDDFSAIVATIIILGYISGKLPQIGYREDTPLRGFGYVGIICVIGLVTSYFTGKIDAESIFGPFLEMFKILCGVLIFVLLATNIKHFKEILRGNYTRKNLLVCLIVFALIGLFASYAHVTINGAPANIRCLIVMISGLFGGPIVGIPVGIISGAYRYTLGGTTALPCTISTIISGIIGSLIFMWNDKEFPRTVEAVILMFLFTGFEMFLVVMMTPPNISFPFIRDIYPMMLFASVIGMLLFTLVIKQRRQEINPQLSSEEQKIKELENKLEGYGERIEDLKNEIEELKKI